MASPEQNTRTHVPIRRIVRLFRPHRARLVIVALLVGLSSLVSVASPFLLREVLDVAIPQERLGLLSLLVGGTRPARERRP